MHDNVILLDKQGRKRPLDTPKRMIERRERERKVEGEIQRGGEIKRDRERKMLSPNYVSGSQPITIKSEGDAHGSLFERKILVKSPEPGNKAQRKIERRNYYSKLSGEIISQYPKRKFLQLKFVMN